MTVSKLATEQESVIALPVARSVFSIDKWDAILICGVFMLIVGIGLILGFLVSIVVGVGSALASGGLLFIVGGLYGARDGDGG